MIRAIARKIALWVPPIRRLFNVALAEATRANELVEQLGKVAAERDAFELQLYVLRSDHHRLISRTDEYRKEIIELRAELVRKQELVDAAAMEMTAVLDAAQIELLSAKITSKLVAEFVGLEERLRLHMQGEAFSDTKQEAS